ncbi:LysR family transcriptional regulator [Rhizobiaceae bacterium n13]|uniref:LysR family transcriptional regulator n=1 Tax=Ferirhizobium litorale TaxID=2927786 RepID=A0AAE3U354_9HYPH|nr:LysR family transcriptional regulator [Fererhizobium litorale]MDI7863678.1 LysR family transcriptional regulator [Fererhizobium litorale]MDI7923352.1 LysR family transcriptional regulator [Fererhizobium litorale]
MPIDHAHILKFDLNLLVAFDALMSERNVTRAAQRIGTSQSALSHNLGRLRALLSDELFVRSARGIEPTPRAQELAETVSGILCTIQSRLIEPEQFDPATDERTFTLGLTDYLESLLMPPLLAAVHEQAPNVNFVIRPIDQVYPADLLDSGEIDLAIGKVETGNELHKRRKLWSERYVILSNPEKSGHAGTIDLETFLATPQAVIVTKDGHCRLVDEILADRGLKRHAAVTTPHLFTLPILVRETRMIAAVPASFARAWAPVFGLAISPGPVDVPPYDISLAWHASSDRNSGHAWLRKMVLAALEPVRAKVLDANAGPEVEMIAAE